MAQLDDGFSFGMLPIHQQLAALVMVFDMSDLSSFAALQDWVSGIDVQKFDILLCIGNKADLLRGHFAHAEYRRRLQKRGESSSDPHPEFLDYGILETEGSSLLGEEEPSWEFRRSCLEWCSQNNIEYIESCASNADFDKCLSVDGDSQGVDRLYGALSAHMWPGMVLKSGKKVPESTLVENEDLSDEESDYEVEYELLSEGSAEPWDGPEELWVPPNDLTAPTDKEGAVNTTVQVKDKDPTRDTGDVAQFQATTSATTSGVLDQDDSGNEEANISEQDKDLHLGFGGLEQLMCEISNMRDGLRLMPDFQRKEMAAKLAMKMAAMFGGSSDEEGKDA
eukprot:TRINITY_DN1998_c0_g1_i1.p1 TRINITY_DN1998_c0_g1~~TRINITY_DN1998_c0_g1_i1.p1  ORF type:complete len:349 (-),score=73.30 TRINITY_DN1998_c0_g1_i1:197-1207(-)